VLNTIANALRSLPAGSQVGYGLAFRRRAFGDGAAHNIPLKTDLLGGRCAACVQAAQLRR